MVSQTESWADESDSSADEGEDSFLGGGRVTYRPPRLCRIVRADRVTSFEDFDAARSRSGPCCEGGGGRLEGLQEDWVKVSRCWSAGGEQQERPQQHHVHMWVSKTVRCAWLKSSLETILVTRKSWPRARLHLTFFHLCVGLVSRNCQPIEAFEPIEDQPFCRSCGEGQFTVLRPGGGKSFCATRFVFVGISIEAAVGPPACATSSASAGKSASLTFRMYAKAKY